MAEQLHLNPSLRLVATFKVYQSQDMSVDHYDYHLQRYPVLAEILALFADQRLSAESLQSIDPALAEDLGNKGIVTLNTLNREKPSAIGFQEKVEVTLTIFARYADQPATRKSFSLAGFRNATRWLLFAAANKIPADDLQSLSESDINMLLETGALLEKDPPPIAEYPPIADPDQDWAGQLASAEKLYLQHAGEPIPAKVLQLLGTRIPEIPQDTRIIWACDAGTRLPFATLVPEKELDTLIFDTAKRGQLPAVNQKKQLWKEKLSVAKLGFKRSQYAQLDEIIPPAQQQAIRTHLRRLVQHHYFGPVGDGQVDRRMSIHNEPVTASIHHRLAKLVSIVVGEKVQASYAFLGGYLGGSVLERHLDRPQCQFNLSIVFDMYDEQGNDVDPWPIYLQVKKQTIEVNLDIGSGLLYRGTDIEHWRDALPEGHHAMVCFYHFVNPEFSGTLI